MKRYFFALLLGISLFTCPPSPMARAQEEELPDVLDYDRRKSYSWRFELSPYFGDFFGDKLGHTFAIAGGNFQWNWTEQLSFAVDFGYNHLSVDRTSAFGATFHNDNAILLDGALLYSVPAAYRSTRGGITEADFFTSLGGGFLRINDSNRGGGFIGGGMKIRTQIKWLAMRVEIRNYFTSVPNPAGSDFEDILTIHLGPTFFLPPEM